MISLEGICQTEFAELMSKVVEQQTVDSGLNKASIEISKLYFSACQDDLRKCTQSILEDLKAGPIKGNIYDFHVPAMLSEGTAQTMLAQAAYTHQLALCFIPFKVCAASIPNCSCLNKEQIRKDIITSSLDEGISLECAETNADKLLEMLKYYYEKLPAHIVTLSKIDPSFEVYEITCPLTFLGQETYQDALVKWVESHGSLQAKWVNSQAYSKAKEPNNQLIISRTPIDELQFVDILGKTTDFYSDHEELGRIESVRGNMDRLNDLYTSLCK